MNKYDAALGKVLATERKKKGLTQQQFAEHFGISRELVCNYEKGYRAMNASLFFSVCDYLGLKADDVARLVMEASDDEV